MAANVPFSPARALSVFRVNDYAGADSTGSSDSSSAVQAAINAAYANGGGTVTGNGIFRCDSKITFPFSSDDGQVTVALEGPSDNGLVFWSYGTVQDPTAGFVLDLRYSGTGAKMEALGAGILALRGVRIGCLDSSADTTPLLLVTIPQPRITNCVFFGNSTHTDGSCLQDAIVLGGTGTTKPEDSITAAFSGYGGHVNENSFFRIRKAVLAQNRVNGIVIRGNLIEQSCGSAETNSAPIVIDPGTSGASYYALGNVVCDNTIEITNYDYGIKMNNGASKNLVSGNGFWDPSESTLGSVWLDNSTCTGNTIRLDGYVHSNTAYQAITGVDGASAGLGYNHAERPATQFCGWTHEYKKNGWTLHMKGDTGTTHYLAYDSTADGPLLAGYGGVGVKSKTTGTQYQYTMRAGSGSPESVVTAPVGDTYIDVTNGELYIKKTGSGNTGWKVMTHE